MTAETQRLIGQEIRHQKEALRARTLWLLQQPAGSTQQEEFQRVNFWRNVLRDAEQRLQRMAEAEGPVAVHG